MKITRTVVIDGDTDAEYHQIKAHLEDLHEHHPEWEITYHPLTKNAKAVMAQDVDTI